MERFERRESKHACYHGKTLPVDKLHILILPLLFAYLKPHWKRSNQSTESAHQLYWLFLQIALLHGFVPLSTCTDVLCAIKYWLHICRQISIHHMHQWSMVNSRTISQPQNLNTCASFKIPTTFFSYIVWKFAFKNSPDIC